MGNLKQFQPRNSATVDAIYARHKEKGDNEPARGYLGASIIGHECHRYLWYTFRNCCKPTFSGRMYRLFETGHLSEQRFVQELRDIGCVVHDQQNGRQFEFKAVAGHFAGHMDGCAYGIPEAPKTWHVLEFKTMNAKSFGKLKKGGVRNTKPEHFFQMMVYMHLSGMKRALYMAVNKDTDDLHTERIRYNEVIADTVMIVAKEIIERNSPPERITDSPDFWKCRYCDAKDVCWGSTSAMPALPVSSLNCRQCCHATPEMDTDYGRWSCKKFKKTLSNEDQENAASCGSHLILPALMPNHAAVGHGKQEDGAEYIVFSDRINKDSFKHGGNGNISSAELIIAPLSTLTDKMVCSVREELGGEVTDKPEDILMMRYQRDSGGSAKVEWNGVSEWLEAAWKGLYPDDPPLGDMDPIGKYSCERYSVVEYDGGRIAVLYSTGKAEIRSGGV